MSKNKNSVAAMQRAVNEAKAERDQTEQKLNRDKKKATELREQVRQMKADAARHGVDLDTLPTKKQQRAAAEAAKAAADAESQRESEAANRRSTAERMAEHLTADRGPLDGAPSVKHRYPARSADRIALGLLDDALIGRHADPSRNVLPVDPFLKPTHEVIAGQAQYRHAAQTRTVPPQATRHPLHRPWGAAPGQLGGVKLTQDGD